MSSFRAVVGDQTASINSGTLLLQPGQNLRTGITDFAQTYPDCTSLEQDLLVLASSIFASDVAFKRGAREEITRSIELHVPVVNYAAFDAIKDDLEILLWLLSDDNWTITFHRANGSPESKRKWPTGTGVTILFSGGADSFVGAVELLSQRGAGGVQLASHLTGNRITRQSQSDLASYLESRFGSGIKRISVRTGGQKKGDLSYPEDAAREESQRTRSFMFLAIASVAARRTGHTQLVVIAENGQMAIHVPLSPGRLGSLSTHTAHPAFVAQAGELFRKILDTTFSVENPFLYSTKAEVVGKLEAQDRSPLAKSVSCWRGARVFSALNHCGECIPCLVRRIAFEQNGIVLPEYKRDLLAEDVRTLPEDDEGKRNLVELATFAYLFGTQSEAELSYQFPDLTNAEFDRSLAIAMYKRFASEAEAVFRKYPGAAQLLPPRPPSKRTASKKGVSK